MDNILILAQDQQAIFRMFIPPDNTFFQTCRCIHLDRERMLFRIDAPTDHAHKNADFRAGKAARLDFCAVTENTPRTFRFESLILRVDPHAEGGLLEVIRPRSLERWRRRSFERIVPLRADILAVGVWPWNPLEGVLPADPAPLPAPLLVFLPGKAENVRLADISAAGAGLRVRKRTLAALLQDRAQAPDADTRKPDGTKLPGCLMFLSLREQDGPPLSLWLACVRRHATACAPRPSSLVLGFQITRWAETADAASPVLWKPLASGGETPPLLRWTLRHHARKTHTFHF